jgi:Vacuolar sorting protein 9 (VPS9) domain
LRRGRGRERGGEKEIRGRGFVFLLNFSLKVLLDITQDLGAEKMLPAIIYALYRSKMENLYSECKLLEQYTINKQASLDDKVEVYITYSAMGADYLLEVLTSRENAESAMRDAVAAESEM